MQPGIALGSPYRDCVPRSGFLARGRGPPSTISSRFL